MKQHIQVKQLGRLSRKGRKRLAKWWTPEQGDWVAEYIKEPSYKCVNMCTVGVDEREWHLKYSLPLLSIGQMIEFLDENNRGHEGANILPLVKSFDKDYVDVEPVDKWCDALWEATKEVLEK